MRLLVAALAVLSAALILAPSALAVKPGMSGPKVCEAKWLLSGHKPSRMLWLKPYKGRIDRPGNCHFGRHLAAAVVESKRKLGYPQRRWKPVVYGARLRGYLLGKQNRPLSYLARAATVRKADAAKAASRTHAARLLDAARSQLGCTERPYGSNWGGCVANFILATGFRSPIPWCAAFQQWAAVKAGLGRFANGSAHVFTIVDYSRRHGWGRAVPRPGMLVAFMANLGHIGVVETVTRNGYGTIEGNTSNAVRRRWYAHNSRRVVFIELPRLYQVAR